MSSKIIKMLALGACIATLNGCEIVECQLCGNKADNYTQEVIEPVTIAVTGYGALDPELAANAPQQKLMAMRASEVEAYRSLAERLRGVEVTSNTRVDQFFTDSDHMSAMLHTYVLRNARISSQNLTEEGFYQTTLALKLGERFFQQFTYLPPTRTHKAKYIFKPANDKYNNQYYSRMSTHSTTDAHIDTGVSD